VTWTGFDGKRRTHKPSAIPKPDHIERSEMLERSHQNHLTGLRHSILHAHISRKHWVPEHQENRKEHNQENNKGRHPNPENKVTVNIPTAHRPPQFGQYPLQFDQNPKKLPAKKSHQNARNLLDMIDTEFVNRMNEVQKYSSAVALGDGVVQILPNSSAQQFVRGPILWPSLFIYENGNTCNLATRIFDSIAKAVELVAISYDDNRRPKRPTVSHNPFTMFIDGWQRGRSVGEKFKNETNGTEFIPREKSPSTTPWYIRYPVNLVKQVTGVDEIPMIGLALELPGAISRLFRCNVEAVMFCTNHHYSVFTSAIIAIIILTIVGSIFAFTGVPIIAVMLSLLAFVSLVMFISFEYAPGCTPLIPTCFFTSMVDDIVRVLPTRITIPQSLLSCRWDQFVDGTPPATCIVSCDEPPYQFIDWTSNVAWMLCESYPGPCEEAQLYIENPGNPFTLILGEDITVSMQSALYRSRMVSQSQDQNMREGYSWCNTLTLYKLIPLLLFVVLAVIAVPLLISMIIRTFVSLMRTGISAFAMSHS
jgi:hypothetical protein